MLLLFVPAAVAAPDREVSLAWSADVAVSLSWSDAATASLEWSAEVTEALTWDADMAVETDFSFHVGEDVLVTLDGTGNITGWSFSFVMRKYADGSNVVSQTTGFTITDAAGGTFTLTIASATTLSLPPAEYFYEVRRTDSGHNTVLAYGTLQLLP